MPCLFFALALVTPTVLALAEESRARAVVSTDFGDEWPLTTYSAMVNCVRGGHAIVIANSEVYAINGIAKGFAEQYGYRDIKEISKPHPMFEDVEADIRPLLEIALDMC